jgi:hypothetical protein
MIMNQEIVHYVGTHPNSNVEHVKSPHQYQTLRIHDEFSGAPLIQLTLQEACIGQNSGFDL